VESATDSACASEEIIEKVKTRAAKSICNFMSANVAHAGSHENIPANFRLTHDPKTAKHNP
jgi:hypothetical protein